MKRRWMIAAAAAMTVLMTSTAMAGVWKKGNVPNEAKWWYDDEDGTYAAAEWRWLDGNQDGTAECYAFDKDGWMYADTTTPDGYQVNADGAWTVNGVVQTQNVNAGKNSAQSGTGSRILVAYYTKPEDGVDTVSGASRVQTADGIQGNVEYLAHAIAETAGADLFRIDTVQSYPGTHAPLVDRALTEQNQNARPALSTHISNLDDYDTIFIGYPIWWSEMPMAMYSFFDEYDFSGKTIIPFSSHGGSGFSGTPDEIRRLEPGANVMTGRTVDRLDAAGDRENTINWVRSLGLQ